MNCNVLLRTDIPFNDNIIMSALRFLDKNSFYKYLRQEVRHFQENVEKHIFKISLEIPVFDLMEEHPSLCEKVLHHPQEALQIFIHLVYMSIHALKLSPCDISMTQILVNLRLGILPPLFEYQILDAQDLCQKSKERRYFEVQGILSSLSSPSMYSLSARYFCQQDGCEFHQGNKLIRVFTPGATEGETVSNDFTCKSCGGELKEDLKYRTLGEKVVARVIVGRSLHCHDIPSSRQPIFVCLRDELSHGVHLGQKYIINGIPISFPDKSKYFGLEACNLQRSERVEHPSLIFLPDDFQMLLAGSQSSPWRFALNLGYLFGAEVSPPGLCHRLKLGLLLNLIAERNEIQLGWNSTSILTICNDDLQVKRLLKYASQFAEQSVEHSVTCSLTAHVKSKQQGFVVTAGSLHLASDGVCIVYDAALKLSTTQGTLTHVLETGMITATIPDQLSGEFGKQLTYPLACSIWACGLSTEKQSSRIFSHQETKMSCGKLKKPLMNAFGMVYFVESTDNASEEYASDVNCFHTLYLALNYNGKSGNSISNENQSITTEKWKMFIKYAKQQKAVFKAAAEHLLQGYYLASRQVRSNSDGDCELPLSAITTLTYLAKMFAKLMLRSEVTEYDAVMAILLYEESIVSRYGPSSLIMQACSHLTKENFLGSEGDAFLFEFHKSIHHFIMNHSGALMVEE